MISDICKIENGTRDLSAILKESKKVAHLSKDTQLGFNSKGNLFFKVPLFSLLTKEIIFLM